MKYLLTSALAVLCSATGAQAQANAGSLDRGQKLTEGQRITSPNGSHFLIMQDDGNLCINTKEGKFVWCSMSTAGSGSYALFEDSGNLVVFDPDDQLVWSTKTAISARTRNAREAVMYSPARLSLGDDGKLYMLNAKGEGVWSSVDGLIQKPVAIEAVAADKTAAPEPAAAAPAKRVFKEQMKHDDRLNAGDRLASPNGTHVMIMQDDGNLCINTSAEKFVWCTMSKGGSGSYAVFQSDGALVVYSPDEKPVWSSRTSGDYNKRLGKWGYMPTLASLGDDGILVLGYRGYRTKKFEEVWNNVDGLSESLRPWERQ